MYLWGELASRSPLLDQAGDDFITFGGMHLICTMFITTDHRGGAEGAFHRTLDPMGHGDLLCDVDRELAMPVGKTTLRRYIRSKRNMLATHGSLAFSSHAREARDVIASQRALDQFQDAMDGLTEAVRELDNRLAPIDEHHP
jgi:hypothetical protein